MERGDVNVDRLRPADPAVGYSWVDSDDNRPAIFGPFYPAHEPDIQLPDGFLPTGLFDACKLFFPIAEFTCVHNLPVYTIYLCTQFTYVHNLPVYTDEQHNLSPILILGTTGCMD